MSDADGALDEIQHDVQALRRRRSAAKANITKKIKELTEWKMKCENTSEAQMKVNEFAAVAENLYVACSKYQSAISDEYEVIESEEYLSTEKKRIDNFTPTLMKRVTDIEGGVITKDKELKSTDSVINNGKESCVKSRGSIASSRSKSVS